MWNTGTLLPRLGALGALALMLCLPRAAVGAAPPQWHESAYSYNAQTVPLARILADFANSHGVELKLSGDFEAPVKGKLQGATVADFLDRLGTAHRFRWFVYNNTLYVSASADNVFERISVSSESVSDAKAALSGLGLFDSKFGWAELGAEKAVALSGPSEYVRLVKQVVQEDPATRDDAEAMVFRLKYAAVDDREVKMRDQVTVTPGVASMLKSLLSGAARTGTPAAAPGLTQSPLPGLAQNPLTGMPQNTGQLSLSSLLPMAGFGSQPMPPPEPARNLGTSSAKLASRGPQVAGDVRTNSVVIWDSPSKRAYYQKLVDALDVPQRMVEIEALIVDISHERLKEIGAELAIGNSRNNLGLGAAGLLAGGGLRGATLVLSSLEQFTARLQLLESDGEARILAKPSVTTLENLVAVLDLSQTVFMKSTGERVAQVTPVTAGMMLRVIPRVIEEAGGPRIHLAVDIEDGKISSRAVSDTPEVQRSTISTQAILDNRESLVIGGYNSDSTGQNLRAIPGLSSLPLVGALFTAKQSSSESRQRLFIITPRLVGPALLAGRLPPVAGPADLVPLRSMGAPADLIRLQR